MIRSQQAVILCATLTPAGPSAYFTAEQQSTEPAGLTLGCGGTQRACEDARGKRKATACCGSASSIFEPADTKDPWQLLLPFLSNNHSMVAAASPNPSPYPPSAAAQCDISTYIPVTESAGNLEKY